MEAPGQQSILPGAPGCSNILGVLSGAWLGRTGSGQGASMGQGNLPRARAPSPPPVMSNPVSPVGSQGLCATLAPQHCHPHPCLPVRLGTGMAEALRWLQDRMPWHRLGVTGSISLRVVPGPPAAAPSVVSEVPGMCLSSRAKVRCPPASTAGFRTGTAQPRGCPGVVWVCPGKGSSGGSCLHPCAGWWREAVSPQCRG